MIEINPRISTIVYQEDLNLPWLGVKHALGEISDGGARRARRRGCARRGGRCATSTRSSGTSDRAGLAARGTPPCGPIPNPHPPTGQNAGRAVAAPKRSVVRARAPKA